MIFLFNHQKVSLQPQVPPCYENYLMQGAEVLSWSGPAGIIFLQEVAVGDVRLSLLMMSIKSTFLVEAVVQERAMCLFVSLNGKWLLTAGLKEPKTIGESHSNLLFNSSFRISLLADKNQDGSLLIVAYTKEEFRLAISSFPPLIEFERKLEINESFVLFAESPLSSPVTMDAVFQAVQSSYFPEPRSFHITLLSKLLSSVCEQAAKENSQVIRYGLLETNALFSAKNLIDHNLYTHFTIAEISKHCGLNRQKLRVGFKALFGKGLYEYLLHKRLEIARDQLEASRKPIKEIGRSAGYRNASNFSTACKKYFGLTPAEIRDLTGKKG